MNNIEAQDIGIILSIGLFGARYNIFDLAFNSDLAKSEFLLNSNFDSEYFDKWLDAAIAYDFVKLEEDKLCLTDLGKLFSTKSDNSQLANLIQGVFSVLIAHEALPFVESGYRPGYEIVNKFQNISPWFDFVNQKKNDSIINEIITNSFFTENIKHRNGNIADFSCGNGWLLEKIKKQFENCMLFGVNGRLPDSSTINSISSETFFKTEEKYSLIILNKVLHHIWNEEELINNITSKLTDDGVLLIWEFVWSDEIKHLPDYREVAFLNLIEHIQNSSFLTEEAINNYFKKIGFQCSKFKVDDGKQIIYIIKK